MTTRRSLLKLGGGIAAGTIVSSKSLGYQRNETKTDEVTIKRDEYGVAHVYAREADDSAPTFFGYGYATAEDRLYQLELSRRFYHGTVSEVLGSDWVEFDKASRRTHFTQTPLEEQIATQLDGEHRTVISAFAEGINRYIEAVKGGEREWHKGFVEAGFEPDEWTMEDVAGVFVGTMAYFSGFQLETLGSAVLERLRETYSEEKAMALFRDLQWGDDPGAPTSTEQSGEGYVPPYENAGTTPSGRDKTDSMDGSVVGGRSNRVTGGDFRIPNDASAVHDAEMERIGTIAQGLDGLGLPIKLGSNALAVHGDVTESGDPLLMGGPQMGFSTPSVMYEIGLHGPGFDISGSTVTGYPFVMFGHNEDGAFTSTAGIDNSIQTFVESIVPREESADQYEFRGELRDVKERDETIPIADAPDETITLRWTHHGTVTQYSPDTGEALAQTRGFEGRDMNCWRAFYDAQFASDVHEYGEAAQQCDYALNFMWAGGDDIGYFHLGRYPDAENVPWDTRLPADGTKHELTEDDYLRAADDEVPYAINPPSGYSAQWNNKPAPDWDNGDLSYSWGTDHRVQRIINLVERRIERGGVRYEDVKDIVYDISFVDLRAIRYKDHLLDSLKGSELSKIERDALNALRRWNDYRQGDGAEFGGSYPVGFTVFDAFFPRLLEKTFSPVFGDAYDQANYFLDYRYGHGTLMRALHPEETTLETAVDYFDGQPDCVFRDAFRETVTALEDEYGCDVSNWQQSAEVDELDNMALFGMPIGVGDAGDMPFLNRGTENHIVRMGAEIRGENILPPGNSGYVAPDGTPDEHYDDQLEMFVAFEYKDLLFTDDEIDEATESEKTIQS
ncbi:penicillin amidase [Haladaptatus litoreus]|uniref:Penicillin amidase n=1 Tax=Haladaptatus litoreus TaxID=553468 RepID=A0A1N7DYX6_9EURY|nr:penicillin acylase family protein [Haladaptatus litoreus]SIR81062.1 penicillin amidase [Haladaptatus litoreus]